MRHNIVRREQQAEQVFFRHLIHDRYLLLSVKTFDQVNPKALPPWMIKVY